MELTTGTIMDTVRAAHCSPSPSIEMIKRVEEMKKRLDAENRTRAVSDVESEALYDLSKMFGD